MSNSSRIEVATRQHVNAVLTSEQIVELVKIADPTSTKGVYPSDCAGKRLEDGTLTYRGKTAYGDLVLEYLGANSFKVLPTEQIVRRAGSKKAATPEVKAEATPAVVTPAVKTEAKPVPAGKKKAAKSQPPAKPPVIAKQKATDRHAAH